MRRGNKAQFIEHEGVYVGINLGSDFTAEHEWGIKNICDTFGINSNTEPGVARRRVSNARPDKNIFFVETPTYSVLIGTPYGDNGLKEGLSNGKAGVFRELSIDEWNGRKMPLGAAWSGSDFGMMVPPENSAKLRELYEAFVRNDVAIYIGGTGGNPFANGGLTILIASRIPESGLKTMADHDIGVERLRVASEATGIIAKLEATQNKGLTNRSGCLYFACSPRFIKLEEKEKRGTKYDVIYWLNPEMQDRNNYGWFTVEELEQWIDGKGPIPMKTPKVRG